MEIKKITINVDKNNFGDMMYFNVRLGKTFGISKEESIEIAKRSMRQSLPESKPISKEEEQAINDKVFKIIDEVYGTESKEAK